MNYKKEIIVRSIKIFDIGYITVLNFIFGYFVGLILSKFITFNEEEYKRKSLFKQFFEIIVLFFLIGILTYFIRNIIEMIPFPLDGLYGFQHFKVKELNKAMVFTYIIMYSLSDIRDRLVIFDQHFHDVYLSPMKKKSNEDIKNLNFYDYDEI